MKFSASCALVILASIAYSSALTTTTPFNGDTEKWDKAVDGIYKKLDANNDGVITKEDVATIFSHAPRSLKAKAAKAEAVVSDQVKALDLNNDGILTKEEFKAGVKEFSKISYPVDNKICEKAAAAREKCKAEISKAGKIDPHLPFKIQVGKEMCSTGGAGLLNHQIQGCVVAATNCQSLIGCYNPAGGASTAVSTTGGNQALNKRAFSSAVKAIFWTSLILFGLLQLVLLPFYIILGIIVAIIW